MVRRYAVRAIAEIDGDDASAFARSASAGPRRSLGGGGPGSRVLCSAADMAATLVLMLPLLIACGDAAAQTRPDARQLVARSAADPQVRAKAACGLRELGDDAAIAVDALVALLPDGAPIPMTVCERNWGRWGHEPTTTPGEQAASALVSIGSRTLKPLLAAVSHSSWIARRNAAWALGALDDASASPALMKALNDSESPTPAVSLGARRNRRAFGGRSADPRAERHRPGRSPAGRVGAWRHRRPARGQSAHAVVEGLRTQSP